MLGELEPGSLEAVLAPDVRAIIAALRGVPLSRAVDEAAARGLWRGSLLGAVQSRGMAEHLPRAAVAAHHGVGTSSATLREVVERDRVEALAKAVLALRGDGRLLTERLLTSPSAVTVGVRIVGRIVSDVLAQNRALAEKVPGIGGLVSLGAGAINRAGRVGKAVADGSGLDRIVGEAVGAGAKTTVRRSSAIVHEVLTDELLLAIVLELYDAHADLQLAELRIPAEDDRIEKVAIAAHRLTAHAAASSAAEEVIDTQVDAFLAAYADLPVADLLMRLGLTEDALVHHLAAALAPPLAAMRHDGSLERLVHARLSPFWQSAEVAALLAPQRSPEA